MITTMIAQTLEDYPDVFTKDSIRLEPGDAELRWRANTGKEPEARLLLAPMIKGFKMLARDYSEYISLRCPTERARITSSES